MHDMNKDCNVSLSVLVKEKLQQFINNLNGQKPAADFYAHVIKEIERPLIELALTTNKGNRLQTASWLGINRNTLRKKMKELDL